MFGFLGKYHRQLKETLPVESKGVLSKLIVIAIALSILDFAGLVVIIPIINILMDASLLESTPGISHLYELSGIEDVQEFSLLMLGIAVVAFIIKNLIIYVLSKKQAGIAYDTGYQISRSRLASYLNRDSAFHQKSNSGFLVRNTNIIPAQLAQGLLIPFSAIVNELIIGGMIALGLVIYDVGLFLSVVVFFAPALWLYLRLSRRKLDQLSEDKNKASAQINVEAYQTLNSHQEIKLFRKLNYFLDHYSRNSKTSANVGRDLFVMNNLGPRIVEVLAVLAMFGMLLIGIMLNKDSLTLGQFLIAFAVSLSRLLPSANRIIVYSNSLKAHDFVFDHLKDMKEFMPDLNVTEVEPLPFSSRISLNDIHFRFDGQDKPIFEGLDLEISKGDTIGIMGESGAGKTTLINLILQLQKQEKGQLKVDDTTISDSNIASWYDLIGLIPQNVNVIDGSLAENIAFGVPADQVDEERLKVAIERAHLTQFTGSNPAGIHASVGEGGVKISGGQKQRLAIARALYKDAQILIFDEATSSLDDETESMVTESIQQLSDSDLTIIIVAHRKESLKPCNKIYKLIDGKLIIQEGVVNG